MYMPPELPSEARGEELHYLLVGCEVCPTSCHLSQKKEATRELG